MDRIELPEEKPAWAILELMGHIRYGGLVSRDSKFGTALLRVDVPETYEHDRFTQLVNPASVFRITFCEEMAARHAASIGDALPLKSWELPQDPEKGGETDGH